MNLKVKLIILGSGCISMYISVKGAVKKSEEVEKIRIFMQFGNICYGIWFA